MTSKQIQLALNLLGFNVGSVDGIIGVKTKSGIKKYQASSGLVIDGIAGVKTQASLKNDIKTIQNNLNLLGFDCGVVDGLVGTNTLSGVKSYQKARGLVVDGIVGENTRASISKDLLNIEEKEEEVESEETSGGVVDSGGSVNKGIKIGINAGHGGKDPGAVGRVGGQVYYEKDLNLNISKYLSYYLRQMGYEVVMTRTSDVHMYLSTRCNIVNKEDCDIYVSIHNNAGGGDGCEFIYYPTSSKGLSLARKLRTSIQETTNQNFRRYIPRTDYDVKYSNMPAVICECAFVDTTDVYIIAGEDGQKLMAKAIAIGVDDYFS